ncbi:MAG: glycosyltransferase family 4 protein [Sphingomicrobium sp.]
MTKVQLHVPRHFGPIQESDVPDADAIIATWWETAEWLSSFSDRKGAKVHFIQGYEAFPNIPNDRVEAVWRLPTAKIVIAQWLIDLGRQKFGIEDMALVPNSVDHHIFSALRRAKGAHPTVGFLFHKAEFKDLPTTLATVDRLRQAKPDLRFVSFGATRADPGELPAGVEFHHLPAQEQIADIYRRCDVWLSTSRSEGFNLPPIEAMACGTPAICAKTGRPLEVIENGVNGYLVEVADVAGFADAVAAVLSLSNAAWRKMSIAAERSVAHPTWDESSALFEQALIRTV